MRIGDWMILGHGIGTNQSLGRNVNPQSIQVIKSAKLGNFELYNLKTDLAQKNDVAGVEKQRFESMVRKLVARHKEVQTEGRDWFAK